MATPRADRITANYRTSLRRIRAETDRRVAAAYRAKLRADEIRTSYNEDFLPLAAHVMTAGQGAAVTTTRAYIRGTSGADPVPTPKLAGTSKAGTMAEGLLGIMPFILGAIKRGEPVDTALGIGQSYVERMADAEVTRVVDAEINAQVSGQRAKGWIGIVNGPCDMCVGNAGEHSWDEEMVRHSHCQCEREIIWEDYAYTVPTLAPA